MKTINFNNDLINIIFRFMTGDKYLIKTSPNITVDELISYFIEIFCVNLTLTEFKEKVVLLHNAKNLSKYGSKNLKEMEIYNGAHGLDILVIDQNDVIDLNLIKIKTELKEQSDKKQITNLPTSKGFNLAPAYNKLNSNESDGTYTKINTLLQESMIENKLQKIKLYEFNNTIIEQELILPNGKYVGQVVNGKAEGKGFMHYSNGNRYEGYFINNIREGKGIFYLNNGDRYEGDFKNDKAEGKEIYYYKSGDRYEGNQRNNKKEGKGIYYYKNGDKEIGDYKNGKKIGKHTRLTKK